MTKFSLAKASSLLAAVLLSISFVSASATNATHEEPNFSVKSLDSQQLVVVLTPDESSISGQLMTFSLDATYQWHQETITADIVVGRTGIAWGIGLHPQQLGQQKQEGDGKAPAGVFALGDAFGYLSALNTQLNYTPMTANDYCIDVVASPRYNEIVSTSEVPAATIKQSSEPMRRDIHKQENLYKKGIVVHHNPNNIAPNGSCIFIHIWRSAEKPTAGCTAMTEANIDQLLAWLSKDKKPLFVTLTRQDYQRLQQEWQLPNIEL
jgi:L,D-peptidoglycan transpeptidase YkuD (ErfK/YbiS/YcfS/YnhG family)